MAQSEGELFCKICQGDPFEGLELDGTANELARLDELDEMDRLDADQMDKSLTKLDISPDDTQPSTFQFRLSFSDTEKAVVLHLLKGAKF
jgi:hypothetical protein